MNLDQLDFSVFVTAHGWIQLLTLTVLEIVLGIDNIIIISILSGELPASQQRKGGRDISMAHWPPTSLAHLCVSCVPCGKLLFFSYLR